MNTVLENKSTQPTLPVSRLDLLRAKLSRQILGLTVKASGRTRIQKISKLMGKHDNLRNSAYKIYHAKISHTLAMAQAEVLQKIHTQYQPLEVVTAGDVPGHEFHGNQYTVGFSGDIGEEQRQSAKTSIDEALAKVSHEHVKNLHISVTNGDFGPLGGATYIPPNKQKGYVSDQLMTQKSWLDKGGKERHIAILHEVGHRIQLHTDKATFREFKKQGFGKHFPKMHEKFGWQGNLSAYPKSHHSGEAFAESFARYHADNAKLKEHFPEMHEFWSGKSGSSKITAADPKPRKATVNLNFDLHNFSERFMTGVNEAAEDSFQVISRGLLSELGEGEEVTPQGVITKFINKRENKVVGCPEEIYKSINSELEAGTQAGDTMDELAKRIQDKFEDISKGRAMVIAQTETQSVYGTAQSNAIKQAGFEKKQWVSYHDDKVRESHEECNDEGAIPVDQPFSNGLMYPGDPNGPADEVIGCRCYLIAVEDGEEEEDV